MLQTLGEVKKGITWNVLSPLGIQLKDLMKLMDTRKPSSFTDTIIDKYVWFLLFCLVYVLLISFLIAEITSVDFWFHLKIGEWIFLNHKVPTYDILSHTASEHPYLDSHWLFQFLIYSVYNWTGLKGLVFLKICIFSISFYCLLKITRGRRSVFTIFLIIIGVVLVQERSFLRPEMMTFLFSTLYLLILSRYKESFSKSIYLLPVLQVLWTNMHGLFIIGIFIVFCFVAGELIAGKIMLRYKCYEDTPVEGKHFNKLFLVFLVMIVCTFINPYGVNGAAYPFLLFSEIGQDAHVWMKNVEELYPTFSYTTNSTILLYYQVFVIFTGFSFFLSIRKIQIPFIILYTGLLYTSLLANRNISLLVFPASFIAISNLGNMSERFGTFCNHINRRFKGLLPAAYICLLVFVALCIKNVVSDGFYTKGMSTGRFGFGISARFPEGAVEFIKDNKIEGNIFNDNVIGGFLAWRLHPWKKIFIDGRWEVYGEKFLTKYGDSIKHNNLLQGFLKNYNVKIILLNHESMESNKLIPFLYQSKDWKLIYFDSVSSLFVQNNEFFSRLIKQFAKNPSQISKNDLWLDNHPKLLLARGMFLKSLHRYDEALDDANRVIDQFPFISNAYNLRGSIFWEVGMAAKALEDFNRTINLKNTNWIAYLNRGIVYLEQGDLGVDKAITDFNTVLALNPDSEDAYLYRGIVFMKEKLHDKALNDFQRVISLDPSNLQAYNRIGVIYWEQGALAKALYHYDKAVTVNPENSKAYRNRGEFLKKMGDYSKALTDFNSALQIEPDYSEGYLSRGMLYLNKPDPDIAKSLTDIDKAIDLNPEYSEAYFTRAIIYNQKKEYKLVIADLNRVIDNDPDNFYAYNNRGMAHWENGNSELAINDLKKALELNPENTQISRNLSSIQKTD